MPRRRKPVHLKLIEGTYRPDREPKPSPRPARVMPRPPSWLSKEARDEWKRIGPELHALGLLTRIDRNAFAAYCGAYADWVQARKELERLRKEGREFDLVGTKHGKVANPLHRTVRQAAQDMTRYGALFGLNPTGRSRINAEKIRRTETPPEDDGDEHFPGA